MGVQIPITHSFQLPDGREVIMETGKLAAQAHGSAMIRLGDTMILATVVSNLVSIARSLLTTPKRAATKPRPTRIQPTPRTVSQFFATCPASCIPSIVVGVGAVPK